MTRMASTTDGIHFQYEGVAVTTKMFDAISEASYARVFRYTLPGKDNRYIMLLMGNNQGTRRIYLAWSKDGRTWETRRTPLLDPPAGTNQIAQAWYFPWQGRHYLIFHGHLDSFQTANLYAAEIDPAFERPTHRAVLRPRLGFARQRGPDEPVFPDPRRHDLHVHQHRSASQPEDRVGSGRGWSGQIGDQMMSDDAHPKEFSVFILTLGTAVAFAADSPS